MKGCACLLVLLANLWPALPTVRAADRSVKVPGPYQRAITHAIELACKGDRPGTVVFPNGTFGPVTEAIHVPSECTLTAEHPGGATLNITNHDYGLFLEGDDITVTGLVFSGGGVITTRSNQFTPQSNIVLTHNTFKNIDSGKNGISTNGAWRRATVSFNTFSYISNIGWASHNYSGAGIVNTSGMDESKIEHNQFDHILDDCVHLVFNFASSKAPGTYTAANNNSVSYNVFRDFHRMALELQGQTGSCYGGCSYFPNIHHLKIAGNFAYAQFAPYYDSMIYSLVVDHSIDTQVINNTAIMGVGTHQPCGGAEAMENTGDNALFQGNVLAATTNCTAAHGWPAYSITGSVGTGTTNTHQNEFFCGASPVGFYTYEGPNNSKENPVNVVRHNYTASTCPKPAEPHTSMLTAAWISADRQTLAKGRAGTWSLAVTDQLSIVQVRFFLDGADTPAATQELSDLNPKFSSDRRWIYHFTLNASLLKPGVHTVSALVTDVSGAAQTVKQTFQIGS